MWCGFSPLDFNPDRVFKLIRSKIVQICNSMLEVSIYLNFTKICILLLCETNSLPISANDNKSEFCEANLSLVFFYIKINNLNVKALLIIFLYVISLDNFRPKCENNCRHSCEDIFDILGLYPSENTTIVCWLSQCGCNTTEDVTPARNFPQYLSNLVSLVL